MKELEIIYKKRKQQLLPIIFGFAAVFVLFRIVFPQWTDIADTLNIMNVKSEEVKAKEATFVLLNSIPDEKINKDYATITTAIPTQKDIVLIYTELSSASNAVGVKLGGFNVKIGGIYSTSTTKPTEKTISGVPFMNIIVSVAGSGTSLSKFADKLYESVPLVEIKSVDIGKNDARYDVNFYFKPITVRPKESSGKALEALTPQDSKLLEQLEKWRVDSSSGF